MILELFRTFAGKKPSITGCVFSTNSFNLYSKEPLREIEVLLGYMIGGHDLKSNIDK